MIGNTLSQSMRSFLQIALVTVFMLSSHPAIAGEDDKLDAIIDAYWQASLEADPFSATYSGQTAFNDKVPDVSPEAINAHTAKLVEFQARLNELRLRKLDDNDALNAQLLSFILKHDIAQASFDPWRIPFLADTGFHTNFSYLVDATSFRTEKDYTDYLTRLRGISGYITQHISNMQQGLADGFTQPKEIMPFILPSFAALVKDEPTDYLFYRPFETFPDTISSVRQEELSAYAREIIETEIAPSFVMLEKFMRVKYAPNARETIGAGELTDGAAYYEGLVRFYTSRDDATADEIHELGLAEVARIRAEMVEVIRETDFDGSFDAFTAFLRTDPQFYAKTSQDLLERAAWLAKDIDGKLPAFFGKLPRQPYSVEPVPADIAKNYTTGRYVGAPANADRGGQYWVNTYALDKRPLYQLAALTLHEATPGHHLQGALSLEIGDVPAFRAQFYPHAFGEGWGLYAEKLGVEMDVYKTPYDHFGRLSYEMWRACRLVIDTGLHAKRWTRQDAIDYLAGNTALSSHNVQTEVDRYISWPGQALAYKIGELTLWELRAHAKSELGDAFDVREFHDAVLAEGGLPLEVLRVQIDNYIAGKKAE